MAVNSNDGGDVLQLRRQIEHLTDELHSLRSNLSASSTTFRPLHQSIPPPLPPRTHRAPPKPQRTFDSLTPPKLPPRRQSTPVPLRPPSLSSSVGIKSNHLLQLKAADQQQHYFRRCSTPMSSINSNNTVTPIASASIKNSMWKSIGNLSSMREPISVESIAAELTKSFKQGICFHELGALLLFVNPFNDLVDNRQHRYTAIDRLANDLCQQMTDVSGQQQQTVVFSGQSGSGKSYLSQQLLRELSTRLSTVDSCNILATNLSAAFVLLNAFGSLSTVENAQASRMAISTDLHISDGSIVGTKINCIFTDCNQLAIGNACIFAQILAGLSPDERAKFHLANVEIVDDQAAIVLNSRRFETFRIALTTLGIPFSDVMRVLSACLLLSRVRFVDDPAETSQMLEIEGQSEFESVAALLGLSSLTLYKALTKKTRQANGHKIKAQLSANAANMARIQLATSIYHRSISAIVRRINAQIFVKANVTSSTTIVGGGGGAASGSDSDSIHDSGIGLQMRTGNCNRRSIFNGRLAIVDIFGINASTNIDCYFDTLCVNLIAEKQRQFCQARIFLDVQNKMNNENVYDPVFVELSNTAAILEAFLAPKFGILYLLDDECEKSNGTSAHFLDNVKSHQKSSRTVSVDASHLIVRHFNNQQCTIKYDCSQIVTINRNQLSVDMVAMFGKSTCNFGFVSYLFANDIDAINADSSFVPKVLVNVGPAGHKENERPTTFSEDFVYQIDTLLRSTTTGRLYFVHCIKSNVSREYCHIDTRMIERQIEQLDLVPLARLVAVGYPYAISLDDFNDRYRFMLTRGDNVEPDDSSSIESFDNIQQETTTILDAYLKAVDDSALPYISNQWIVGTQHIFLSHGARLQLDTLKSMHNSTRHSPSSSESITWPCEVVKKLEIPESVPPPLPPDRPYTIAGCRKHCFPQRRTLIESFRDESTSVQLNIGDIVRVIGLVNKSQSPTQLLVETTGGSRMQLPAQITRLSQPPTLCL